MGCNFVEKKIPVKSSHFCSILELSNLGENVDFTKVPPPQKSFVRYSTGKKLMGLNHTMVFGGFEPKEPLGPTLCPRSLS